MVATEAVYHLKCLNELYNKYPSFCRTSFRENESNFIEGTYNNILAIQALSATLRKLVVLNMSSCCLALRHFFSLSLNKLWVVFGVDQNRKYLPIHKIVYSLGDETCRALPMWFTLTGCDRKSIFSGRGKKTAWKVWKVFPEVTETFVRYLLSCQYTLCITLFSLSISLFQF